MKRTVPLLITALAGFVLLVSMFIPAFQQAGEEATIWFDILAAIAFILGGANLFQLQLKKISDQTPGWGYAAVTLFFFVLTLLLGFLKIGAPPEASMEGFGETAVPFPLSSMPVYRVPLTVPAVRGDGALLPKSAREQVSVTSSDAGQQLSFTGWMNRFQKSDLLSFLDQLAWKCQIEQLADAARPSGDLAGKVRFDAGHEELIFAGRMSEAERDALLKLLPASGTATQAVGQLFQQSRVETSRTVKNVPSRFSIPESQQDIVELNGETLTVHGPMSPQLRDDLAITWCNDPKVRPLSEQQKEELFAQINAAGTPLTARQQAVFDNFFAGSWTADLLILALNSAGISEPQPKNYCELLAEVQAGTQDPELTRPASPAVELNALQKEAIEKFVSTPAMTWQEMVQQLESSGELIPPQRAALDQFFKELPTLADQKKELCLKLLAVGPLSTAQKDLLLQGVRDQFQWRQQIGELFLASHRVRFPWSGHYSAQGIPFWWLFEYVLQPLMTTTFALLAFYVASAAFRAFRAKNIEAILLLGTAFIILLGRTPAGPALTGWIPDSFSAFRLDQMTAYIMSIFNTAGNRAIMIGIALGTISISLKVLLGIDRSYLGKGD